mgnify:CR=1 FL=1
MLLGSIAFLYLAPFMGLKSLTYFFLLVKFYVLAQCFNLIAGYVGYVSFGHVVFFGIGSYIAAILTWKADLVGTNFYFAIIIGGLVTAALAALLGYPLLKLRGAYFAIATLALNEVIKIVMYNVPEDYGGGAFGIPLPQIRAPNTGYYGMLTIAFLIMLIVYLLMVRSKYGIILKAIREDEDAAMVMGINVAKYKTMAFALSAFFMGLAGGIDLQFSSYIYPEAAFKIDTSVQMIVMTMLGGRGTILGPLLGATILYTVGDYVWAILPFSHLVMLGMILIIIVLFMGRGILGTLEDKVPALRGRIK